MSKFKDVGKGTLSSLNDCRGLILEMLNDGQERTLILAAVSQKKGFSVELSALNSFIYRAFKLKVKPIILADFKKDIMKMRLRSSNGDIARWLTKKMRKKVSACQVKAFIGRQEPEVIGSVVKVKGSILSKAWTAEGLAA